MLYHIKASLNATNITWYSILNQKDLGRFWICHHRQVCVCVYVRVQPWFPQQTQLSGPFDCVYVTVTLFQEHVLFERSDKEAQGSSQTRRRGCRVKEVKVRYPQSDTQHLKDRAADREGHRAGVRGRPKPVDLSLGAWRLSGEDRKDLRAEVKTLPDLVWVHLRASWTENQPTRSCWRQLVRPTPTTTRFEFLSCYLSFLGFCSNFKLIGEMFQKTGIGVMEC